MYPRSGDSNTRHCVLRIIDSNVCNYGGAAVRGREVSNEALCPIFGHGRAVALVDGEENVGLGGERRCGKACE